MIGPGSDKKLNQFCPNLIYVCWGGRIEELPLVYCLFQYAPLYIIAIHSKTLFSSTLKPSHIQRQISYFRGFCSSSSAGFEFWMPRHDWREPTPPSVWESLCNFKRQPPTLLQPSSSALVGKYFNNPIHKTISGIELYWSAGHCKTVKKRIVHQTLKILWRPIS